MSENDERKVLVDHEVTTDGYGTGQLGKEHEDTESIKSEEVEVKILPKPASLGQLFRYATALDVMFMIIGSIFAVVHGAGWPVMMIIFGQMTDSFINLGQNMTGHNTSALPILPIMTPFPLTNFTNGSSVIPLYPFANPSLSHWQEEMTRYSIYYCIVGGAVFVASYFQVCFWTMSAERQTLKIRKVFFKSILRQEIGWFDKHQSGELTTRLTDDMEQVRTGIGDKFSLIIQFTAAFFSGFAIGFWKSWKLALVMMSLTPLLAIAAGTMAKVIQSFATREQEAYAKAGSVAEEVLSCIRTVALFSGQPKECIRYDKELVVAKNIGIRKSLVTGISLMLTMFIIFSAYALAFWYGPLLVSRGEMSGGEVLTVFFCVMIGSMSLGNAGPNLQFVASAKGAAATLIKIIDNEPSIDASSHDGIQLDNLSGHIEFRNVSFAYPTREDVTVLKDFSIEVKPGQTVALVGASGCGKSTAVSLLLRFYDAASGEILIDGHDIKSLNLQWLRQSIGLVSQEPVLFGYSIRENIELGQEGVTFDEIVKAAKDANAHDFISNLPNGYDTLVGERGAQLSGGQKQRIAIARALVRDPRILLLDEATSALDTESEKVVQTALDKLVVLQMVAEVEADELAIPINAEESITISHEEKLLLKRQASLKRQSSTVSQKSLKEEDPKLLKEEVENPHYFRILKMNLPECGYILFGCFWSAVAGVAFPIWAIFFSEVIKVFMLTDANEMRKEAMFWALMFLALGGVLGVSNLFFSWMFGVSGEKLTLRMRSKSFKAILRQDIGWFDDPRHNTGALTTRLATDASNIKNATGVRIGTILQAFFSMVAAMVIAFIYGWQLALALLACVPLVGLAGLLNMKAVHGHQKKDQELLENAGKTASEAIENMRTVASLTREPTFYETYSKHLKKPYFNAMRNAHVYGISFGFAQGIMLLLYAGAFRFGAFLVGIDEIELADVFKVFFAVSFAGMALGQSASFLPDYSKAKHSAGLIFKLFDTVPPIDIYSQDGMKPDHIVGEVTYRNVYFNYPSRPDVKVLRGININVNTNQRVALVGASGCGKSTMVSLLERFYNPYDGQIMVDGKDVRDINLNWLRHQMSVVSQEPILFNCSIAENIAYGVEEDIPHVMIEEAAKTANIHDFIVSLPKGYETVVGEKGSLLSGGQKQRVAIARALITNPTILLLDEATSALDTESEKIVQNALDKAMEGRTCIVIAHRLSTIQSADQILVIEDGRVIEQGTHKQLIAMQGAYYTLTSGQRLT
uniref:Multidrug resistance protein 1-like n=1 Tax=Saccoglossus kowalevskii TaxID=10224 RepID=A0ABM0LYE9_SACKO|nr:PREDICTED: multidrug resistance protein 1-like [Saccoglossus kowalevskii]